MALTQIEFNNKVENNGATVEGQELSARVKVLEGS
jgi:hypothetical protein